LLKPAAFESRATGELVPFAFWSVLPFILAVSLVATGRIGQFEIALGGAFVLIGLTTGIPTRAWRA
jgi:hypothetical protein